MIDVTDELIGYKGVESVEQAVPLNSHLTYINLYGIVTCCCCLVTLFHCSTASCADTILFITITKTTNKGNKIGPEGAVSLAKLVNKLPALETLLISSRSQSLIVR